MNHKLGILAMCLVGYAPGYALCQGPPDFGKGITPFTIYDSTAIDNVNMTNGNVYVHIPLLSYPQRGKTLNLSFSLAANTRSWVCGWTQYVEVGEQTAPCTWGLIEQWAGVQVVADHGGGISVTSAQLPSFDSNGNPNGQFNFFNYAYNTPDGGVHYFYSGVGGLGAENGYLIGGYPAVDGSGYNPVPLQSQHGQAVDRNGVGVGGSFQTDADGNMLTLSSPTGVPSNYIDTLNRTIPDPSSGSTLTAISNCPASSQASSAMLWTVPAPSTTGGDKPNTICATER